MFYVQLLRSRSPKAQNDYADLTVFFERLGSTCVKAVCRSLMKLTPGFCMRLLHFVAIFVLLTLVLLNQVSYKKSQCNVENAWGNWIWKLSLTHNHSNDILKIVNGTIAVSIYFTKFLGVLKKNVDNFKRYLK